MRASDWPLGHGEEGKQLTIGCTKILHYPSGYTCGDRLVLGLSQTEGLWGNVFRSFFHFHPSRRYLINYLELKIDTSMKIEWNGSGKYKRDRDFCCVMPSTMPNIERLRSCRCSLDIWFSYDSVNFPYTLVGLSREMGLWVPFSVAHSRLNVVRVCYRHPWSGRPQTFCLKFEFKTSIFAWVFSFVHFARGVSPFGGLFFIPRWRPPTHTNHVEWAV